MSRRRIACSKRQGQRRCAPLSTSRHRRSMAPTQPGDEEAATDLLLRRHQAGLPSSWCWPTSANKGCRPARSACSRSWPARAPDKLYPILIAPCWPASPSSSTRAASSICAAIPTSATSSMRLIAPLGVRSDRCVGEIFNLGIDTAIQHRRGHPHRRAIVRPARADRDSLRRRPATRPHRPTSPRRAGSWLQPDHDAA